MKEGRPTVAVRDHSPLASILDRFKHSATVSAVKTETTLIFINQLRQKIGVVFGNPETTTGGNALKFYASVRIDVRRVGPLKVSDTLVGSRTRVKVVKNKLAPPFREAEFDIRWGTGVDSATDLLDYGVMLGVIEKSGSHLSFGGEHLGQGRERARESLLARPPLALAIRTAVDVAAPEHRLAQRKELPREMAIEA